MEFKNQKETNKIKEQRKFNYYVNHNSKDPKSSKYTQPKFEFEDEVRADKLFKNNIENYIDCFSKANKNKIEKGDIEITPFNMNEELEEGRITKEGDFVFSRKQD